MPRKAAATKTQKKTENKEEVKTPKKTHRPTALTNKKTVRKTTKTAAKKAAKGKKPLTPYFLFTQEKREEVKATLKEGEKINQKLAAMWKEMSEEEKKVYGEQYKKAADEIKAEKEKVNQARKEKLAASRAAAKEKKE